MSTEEPIFDFLAKPDNLSIALEVADYVDRLKNLLHESFWASFNPQMELTVQESKYASTWTYQPHPTKNYRTNYGKSYITPLKNDDGSPHLLQLAFGQGHRSSDYRLYWGVRWTSQPKDFKHPELTTLRGILISRRISDFEKPRWAGFGWYKYRLYEPKILVRIHSKSETLINEIVGDVWELFEEVRPSMEAINQQLVS